ncbi:MAG: N-acetylmuramoyl-L-alanine amidase [Pseudomonadota bacterium]
MVYSPNSLLQRLALVLLLSLAATAPARAAEIGALRSWRAPDNTRLVIDLSAPVQYRLSPDSTPARVIVEIEGATTAGPLAMPAVQAPLKALRLERSGSGQRLVIETALELLPNIFQLPPNEKYGHRLVLDLYDKPAGPPPAVAAAAAAAEKADAGAAPKPAGEIREEKAAPAPVLVAPPTAEAAVAAPAPRQEPAAAAARAPELKPLPAPAEKAGATPRLAPAPVAPEPYDRSRYRNIVVAIDPGHGGEDPGAIGRNGSYEKTLTLAIARALQELLEAEPGITAVLTRDGDYFIPLQERRRRARYEHKADIFISIHADAAENRAARGASVFALSLKGAGTATSRFARMLAERENRADLIGGVALDNSDDILRNVLADMVVAGSLEHSLHMGRNILAGLQQIGDLHSPRVEQAGFAVLKEPGMLSLLVETGFISNPAEEKKLTSKRHQREIAEAVARGVRRYCLQYPVPSTYFAWRAERGREGGGKAGAAVAGAAAVSAADAQAATAGNGGAAPVRVSATLPLRREDRPAAPTFVRHKVARGENLTALAAQYRVSLPALRQANKLRGDKVMIGQVLKIPVN